MSNDYCLQHCVRIPWNLLRLGLPLDFRQFLPLPVLFRQRLCIPLERILNLDELGFGVEVGLVPSGHVEGEGGSEEGVVVGFEGGRCRGIERERTVQL